jgi:hypothetical protein
MSQGKPRSGTDSREHFLGRWSRRKHAAVKGAPVETAPPGAVEPASALTAVPEAEPPAPAPLPPVESLTPESDFVPFMRADVDEGLKRRALKTLFQDPRFNVMDGLDVYIDDYSKPDPLPEGWLEKLNQVTRLGDYRPPEEAPAEPVAAAPEPAPEPRPEDAISPPADDAPADPETGTKGQGS